MQLKNWKTIFALRILGPLRVPCWNGRAGPHQEQSSPSSPTASSAPHCKALPTPWTLQPTCPNSVPNFPSIKQTFFGHSTGPGVIFQDLGQKSLWALDAGSGPFRQGILASGYVKQGLKESSQLQASTFLPSFPLPSPLMVSCSVGGSAAGEGPDQSPLKAGLSHLRPLVAAGEPLTFFVGVMACTVDPYLEV